MTDEPKTSEPPDSAPPSSAPNAHPLLTLVRANRRPTVLLVISTVFLVLQHILLRSMAHHHTAHVLLAAGNGPPKAGAAFHAIALLVVRFVSYIVVPGLLLATLAELVAYVLVGPKRDEEIDDGDHDELSIIDADE